MGVGEAPGSEEDEKGIPFVGMSGELLNRYLERHGVFRNFEMGRFDIFMTNVSKYRPYKNNFNHLLGSTELEESLEELKAEIKEVNPNIILAFGNWALYFLTGKCTEKRGKPQPGTGIMNWRGSVLPCTLVEGYKVFACVHPAALLRNYGLNPILNYDIGRAVEQSAFPEIRYPQYEEIVNPPPDRLWHLVDEMLEAEWLSIDIETFPSREMSCFGVTDSDGRGLCMNFEYPLGWEAARLLYESEGPGKIMQYGTYDINFLDRFYNWRVGGKYYDTYIGAAHLMPEFPRGLDFLTSVYTWFPFYKEERKEWKKQGDMSILWSYNIKDIIATYQIAVQQMEELRELYGDIEFGRAA